MDSTKIVGRARFKDGKLILPAKEKNTRYGNSDKQNIPITTLQRFNKSYYQNDKLKSSTEGEGQTLDLSKWKQENQDEWANTAKNRKKP